MRLTKVSLALIFVWFLSWTPYTAVFVVSLTRARRFIGPITDSVPALFCKLSAALNPFIYGLW